MIQEKRCVSDIGFTVTITGGTKLLGAMFNDRNDLGQEIAPRTIATTDDGIAPQNAVQEAC
eukprot:9100175-Pyramimonas_sp.AAC.2